jgi:hypothetical protein
VTAAIPLQTRKGRASENQNKQKKEIIHVRVSLIE